MERARVAEIDAYVGDLSDAQARRMLATLASPEAAQYVESTGLRPGSPREWEMVARTVQQLNGAERVGRLKSDFDDIAFRSRGEHLEWLDEKPMALPSYDQQIGAEMERRIAEGRVLPSPTAAQNIAALRDQLGPSPSEAMLTEGFDRIRDMPPEPPPEWLRGRHAVVAQERYVREVQARESRRVREEHARRQAQADREPADKRSPAEKVGAQWRELERPYGAGTGWNI